MSTTKFNAQKQSVQDFLAQQQAQFFEKPSFFRDRLKERVEKGIQHYGDCLPWKKTWQSVRFRPGEVTLWAGINGHGKSNVMGMVFLWLAQLNKVTLASLEMLPEASLERMVKQAAGSANPTTQYMDDWVDAMDDNFWIYDQVDSLPTQDILAMCHHAAHHERCAHIAIDSVMKCGVADDDYQAQADFVNQLCWIAKRHKTHIHLIHHIRKGDNEEKIPGKFDVLGGGRITDMVDNVFIVHRNKAKERKLEKGQAVEEVEPDSRIRVCKQRHGEWEGDVYLYFDKPSNQYRSSPNSGAMFFDLSKVRIPEDKPKFQLVER